MLARITEPDAGARMTMNLTWSNAMSRPMMAVRTALVWAIVAAAGHPAVAAEPGSQQEHRFTNRLIDSNNPYLLLHAHNPVDWYPWGPEAFDRARAEGKPIFLSVGYSTCYWCHVAERTLYSNPDIAALMNKWFVNVKVDREQRPDVDAIYMLARHLIAGSGGWPNNVFLTPDLEPFYAGSYFPPQADQFGRPGFPQVLRALHEAWTARNDEVLALAKKVHAYMQATQERTAGGGQRAALAPAEWLDTARRGVLAQFDAEHGGFHQNQSTTKFPQTPMLALLLADYRANAKPEVLRALTQTLNAMAYGGIYDQLGGGFHRYSTERTWSVPHFEKMLYDNAQLLEVYAQAFAATKEPLYRYVAEDIAAYLTEQMMASDGGFFTAQDAQIDGVEGASYRWRRGQIESILGAGAAERFFRVYELAPVPEVAGATGHDAGDVGGVIRVRLPIEATLARAAYTTPVEMLAALEAQRQKLLAARNLRPQPLRDEKLNVDLNGLAIEAFVTSGQILAEPRYIDAAERAAEQLWKRAYDPATGLLMHQIFQGLVQTQAFLADYALFGRGLMALFRATDDKVWRDRAGLLGDGIIERFMAPDGALAMTTAEANMLISMESTGDSVYPSGTSAAIDLLLRLSASSEDGRHAAAAGKILRHYSAPLDNNPQNWATAVVAVNGIDPRDIASVAAAASTANQPRQPGQDAGQFRAQGSADHVRVSAKTRRGPDSTTVTVTLTIDAGYHVNANPASLDYLIPTTVHFAGLVPERVDYPQPVTFKPDFADEALDVYEGTPTIVAVFPHGAFDGMTAIRATVTAQACNDRICLPPSDLPLSVPLTGPDAGHSN
jgi:uncharacterized protein YyaL (SSP411 family)